MSTSFVLSVYLLFDIFITELVLLLEPPVVGGKLAVDMVTEAGGTPLLVIP